MKIKQAINILSSDTSFEAVKELQYYAGFDKDKVVEQIQEAMNMGAEALKKQISKKPKTEPFYGGRCIVCNALIPNKSVNYCHDCGQKLEWE